MKTTALCAALIAAALAAPAAAEPFTLFIYEAPGELALRADEGEAGARYWQSYAAFAAAATEAGVLRGGSPLGFDAAETVTLTGTGAVDGGYAASELALGGYFQIDVPGRDAALAWAARLPAAASGAVEIRAGYPAPAM